MANLFKIDFGKKNKEKNDSETSGRQSESRQKTIDTENTGASTVIQISPACIIPNPNQPRSDFDEGALYGLAQSIKEHGIIQPLTVRRLSTVSETSPPVYELVAGERRLRASMLLGLQTVPCMVIDVGREASAELAIIENLQREDLNFFEQAAAIRRLIEIFAYSQEAAAKRLAVSQSYIANKLRLLRLEPEEREKILENQLTERHSRALLRISDSDKRRQIIDIIIARRFNVAETERYIENLFFSSERSKVKAGAEKKTVKSAAKNKLIINDVRFFLNSIERAIDIGNQNGIPIKSEKVDKGEFIEINLRIPKNKESNH